MGWITLGLVTLIAATVQGAIGFAFTLLTVTFFLLILQSTVALQVALLLNLVICGALSRGLWKDVPLRLWRRLLVGALVGIPLGAVAFAYANLRAIYLAVALTVLTFTTVLTYRMLRGTRPAPGDTEIRFRSSSVFAVGAVAGAMTAALSMPGPVLVLYLSAIGLNKATFRALSLTLFTALYIGAILVQSVTVGISTAAWGIAAALLPLAWIGAAVGHRLARHIDEVLFRRVVLVLLAATGSYMLASTLIP